jgi:hypothetical protein
MTITLTKSLEQTYKVDVSSDSSANTLQNTPAPVTPIPSSDNISTPDDTTAHSNPVQIDLNQIEQKSQQ